MKFFLLIFGAVRWLIMTTCELRNPHAGGRAGMCSSGSAGARGDELTLRSLCTSNFKRGGDGEDLSLYVRVGRRKSAVRVEGSACGR